jgi:AraC family transcriptional regulator, regulatory protein of adaptative response / methylated-DNA-[protein]-cysteine methyltransferase
MEKPAIAGYGANGAVRFDRTQKAMDDEVNITDEQWQAVLRRDRRLDGHFVYVALTTGIYCRPSCAGRHPGRRHTIVYTNAEAAERQGFVPCRRCHPQTDALPPAEEAVKLAIEYIERNPDQMVTLSTLSRVTGLTAHHLQRTFKKHAGISPRVLGAVLRVSQFKKLLREGHSITSAIYGAGYESTRTVYETTSKALGMTPAVYQRGGLGASIRYTTADAGELGRVLVAGTERGMCAVFVGVDDQQLKHALRQEYPQATVEHDDAALAKWRAVIQSCGQMGSLMSRLPVTVQQLIFNARVYHSLR